MTLLSSIGFIIYFLSNYKSENSEPKNEKVTHIINKPMKVSKPMAGLKSSDQLLFTIGTKEFIKKDDLRNILVNTSR